MAKIEGNNGDVVNVEITDGWFQNVHTKEGVKLVIKLEGKDEDGNTGIASLWMTDEYNKKAEASEIELALDKLESIGLENRDVGNLIDIFGKPAAFYLSVKDDGKTNYYLQSMVEKLDLSEAQKLVGQIRGRAAKNEAAVSGTPVNGDDNLVF